MPIEWVNLVIRTYGCTPLPDSLSIKRWCVRDTKRGCLLICPHYKKVGFNLTLYLIITPPEFKMKHCFLLIRKKKKRNKLKESHMLPHKRIPPLHLQTLIPPFADFSLPSF